MEIGLKQKLEDDLKQALKSGDKVKRSVIRMVLAAVANAETARPPKSSRDVGQSGQDGLVDGDILGIIAKEVRQREESIAAFRQGNRPDLVVQEEVEKAILQAYLPQQMTRDEIVAEASRIMSLAAPQ